MVGHADVCLTEAETEKQPAVKHGSKEQKIGKNGMPRPQGTQKTVDETKDDACEKGVIKPLGSKKRRGHRTKRLNQPPAGRGSS